MAFSSRLPSRLTPNRLASAVARARESGHPFIDLTVTNPTRCGITYPGGLLAPLASPRALRYDPAPLGLPEAREAVAREARRRGLDVDPGRLVLTSSTSEAYSVLFKLLCEPHGDRALVPAPSYPLFDHLTRLDGVATSVYALEYHRRWAIDFTSIEDVWTSDVRVVLAVSPNNPTGSTLSADEERRLAGLCARHGAALIVDEVFADYRLVDEPVAVPPGAPEALTFRLGGLSKSIGLPQVKLGWIAVDGPTAAVSEALARLEWICDTYLSVSTPVQVAAAALFDAGAAVRGQIQARVRRNHAALSAAVRTRPSVALLEADGGWSAVLRVPATSSEEEMVLELLGQAGVLIHPGFFFDFPHEAFLVLSLLPPAEGFDAGVARLLERVDG